MQPEKYRHASRQGFTLIELLIVMVILGLLAALVLPNIIGKGEDTKPKAAKSQISMMETALDLYRLDTGKYPTTEQGLKALREKPGDEDKWKGPYLKAEIPKDPWGNSYEYVSPSENGDYEIISRGRDGSAGGDGLDADIMNWKDIED